MKRVIQIVCVVTLVLSLGLPATAAVSIELVTVGNPGNTGKLSGTGAGGYGQDRICGAVDYEYKIAKYEITAGQYREFLNAVAKTDTYELYHTQMGSDSYGCKIMRSGSSGNYTYSVAAERANRPVNRVSWGDAARFANWLTNGQPNDNPLTTDDDALTTEDGSYYLDGAMTDAGLTTVTRKPTARYVIPSEDEWFKAAYHQNNGATGDYWDYPTGTNTIPSNDFIQPDPGNHATFRQADYPLSDLTIDAPYYRTEIGSFSNSPSPYGTFDQGGNVLEYTEEVIDPTRRLLRGGAYTSNDFAMHTAHRGASHLATHANSVAGFRVAEVPEPTTLGMLALGGLAMLRRRRSSI
jgi:formylglycine-generating enzyme